MIVKGKHSIQKVLILIGLVVFGILLLTINLYFPLLPGDDLLYQLSFPNEGTIGDHKISSLSDYISSVINHYCNYNPRVLPHAVLQAVLLLPEFFFDLLNTVFFFLLAYVILSFSNLKNLDDRLFLYFFIVLFIWVFHFAIGRAYLWTSGSVNYTWFLIPQLLYLKAFHRTDFTKNDISWKAICFSLLCATTNENVVLLLFLVSFVVSIRSLVANRIFHSKLWTSTLILLLGGLLMLLSPSLQERLVNEGFTYSTMNQRIFSYGSRLMYYLLMTLPLVFIFGLGKFRFDKKWNFLLLLGVLSHIVMILVPQYLPRSAVFPFIVFLLYLIGSIDFDFKKNAYLSGVLIILSILCFITRISFVKDVGKKTKANYQTILDSKLTSDTAYVAKVCYSNKSGSLFCDDFSDHSELIGNEIAESYFDIDKIVIDPKYSVGQRREKYIKQERNESDYSKISYEGIDVFLKQDKLGMVVISQYTAANGMPNDYIVILRGAKRGLNFHKLYDMLPVRYRIFFLDYLEHHAGFYTRESGHEYYNYIFNSDKYSYVVLSLYSQNNRDIIGEPIIIDLKNR